MSKYFVNLERNLNPNKDNIKVYDYYGGIFTLFKPISLSSNFGKNIYFDYLNKYLCAFIEYIAEHYNIKISQELYDKLFVSHRLVSMKINQNSNNVYGRLFIDRIEEYIIIKFTMPNKHMTRNGYFQSVLDAIKENELISTFNFIKYGTVDNQIIAYNGMMECKDGLNVIKNRLDLLSKAYYAVIMQNNRISFTIPDYDKIFKMYYYLIDKYRYKIASTRFYDIIIIDEWKWEKISDKVYYKYLKKYKFIQVYLAEVFPRRRVGIKVIGYEGMMECDPRIDIINQIKSYIEDHA